MTATLTPEQTTTRRTADRAGGVGALVAAFAFVFGIALFVTSFADYSSGDLTPAESIAFQGEHEGLFYIWYLTMFLVFGAAIIPLARALHGRLHRHAPLLADVGAVFAYIWAGLMFATGMIYNIGLSAVSDLVATDQRQAEALWSSIATVADGLGGGNELVGGTWVLLVSVAAWSARVLPRWVNGLGIACGVSALVTLVPGLSDVGMVFGLGSIVWFAGVGVSLLRSPASA